MQWWTIREFTKLFMSQRTQTIRNVRDRRRGWEAQNVNGVDCRKIQAFCARFREIFPGIGREHGPNEQKY